MHVPPKRCHPRTYARAPPPPPAGEWFGHRKKRNRKTKPSPCLPNGHFAGTLGTVHIIGTSVKHKTSSLLLSLPIDYCKIDRALKTGLFTRRMIRMRALYIQWGHT